MTVPAVDSHAFSVVIPVFDVAEYLADFLASLDAQGELLPDDILFIDDGSTDDSAAIVERWIDAKHPHAQLIRTTNGGVSAARNRGLDAARGDWVLFLDPDDVLAPGYFAALGAFVAKHPTVDLVATNLMRLKEPDHRMRNNHPLRFRFAGGTRVAELADDVFIMNAASVAFPSTAVRTSGARFRTGLHASEDALFVAEYLLSLGRTPIAGFVAEAKYGYRKRAAGTSAVDRYRVDPSTYTVRFREGYAPLLEKAARDGGVPSWLQSMLLYEMQWLLPVQLDPQRFAENLDEEQRAETLAGITRCLWHVDDERLLTYDASALPLESRLLILALTGRPLWGWVGAYATMPRGWRKVADLITYSTGTVPDSVEQGILSWYPDYFRQQVLVAHRLRVPSRETVATGTPVVWPRPGESFAQTQDRHRRSIAEGATPTIPAQEGEVYVRRTRPWGQGSAERTALAKERRRRTFWSKDAMIGRVLRPGRALLVENDVSGSLTAVAAQLADLTTTDIVGAPGGPPTGLRFGSLRHRIARARARMIVGSLGSKRPSVRARLRALRALVATDELSDADLLRIRQIAPEFIVVSDASSVDRLGAIGVPPTDIVVSDGGPEQTARILTERMQGSTPYARRTEDGENAN